MVYVVWYLGPNYMVENTLKALYQEYKDVASSDIIYQEFFQIKQLNKEKVQVYVIHLCDVLATLKIRFSDKFSSEEETWMLWDKFFFWDGGPLASNHQTLI